MARGEVLRKLFISFSQENREEFYAAANQLIEEEKNKNHLLLARDLEKIIKTKSSNGFASNNIIWNTYPDPPHDKDSGLALIEVKSYEYSLDKVVLSSENLEIINRIILENRKKEILYSSGLKPISKVLFCGLPGCGKTLTAKVLSGVLELPLVYVNLASVFSSYLGETAVNLKKIFDYVKQGEWIVFFDEFDAIAKDRNTPNEHGEIQRLVNSLLQLIDNSNEQSLFIAATNYESLLDRAVWKGLIPVGEFTLYEIPPLPEKFLAIKGDRKISVTLAFDPPTRHTRGDSYLGVTMEFKLFKNIDAENIKKAFVKTNNNENAEDSIETSLGDLKNEFGNSIDVGLFPGSNIRKKGTLQKGVIKISSSNWKYDGNPMYVFVACNRKWAREGEIDSQRYALVVSLSHSNAEVNLYNQLQAEIKNRIRPRTRIR